MLAKLALRNIRLSVKDYSIYFVTLVFGVAVFYAFNSVESQSVLFDLKSKSSETLFIVTGQFLALFSVVIAIVLGFLVLYANGFIIKRRKREFGMYLMLGMKPSSVSVIVFLETATVGIVSLVVGLGIGFLASQALSFVTAGLFNIAMTQYHFLFSPKGLLGTLVCFVAIFVLSALINTIMVRRYKIITLLSLHEQNARFRVRNPWVSLVIFLISLGVIASSYIVLIQSGIVNFDMGFWRATGLMVLGTFLFFWSLAGFALAVVERTRGIYFKQLAMFTMRQIASKVNVAFVSLSVVCIMLFFSITVFSSGMGLANVYGGNIKEGTLYDATYGANISYENEGGSAEADMKKYKGDMATKLHDVLPSWDRVIEGSHQIDFYRAPNLTYGDFLDKYQYSTGTDQLNKDLHATGVTLIGQSQFNALASWVGHDQVFLDEGAFAVNNNVTDFEDLAQLISRDEHLSLPHVDLVGSGQVVSLALQVGSMLSDKAQIIVPDSVIEELKKQEKPFLSNLNVKYKVSREEGDSLLEGEMEKAFPLDEESIHNGNISSFQAYSWPVTIVTTAQANIESASGTSMMVSYLALYIGLVFLIATASILAIQQLSETSDSLSRYRVLAQIGCDRSMILRSLRTQVVVYFLMPLALSICHAVCAVGLISQEILNHLGATILGPTLLTVVLIGGVYGLYLIVTYFASRSVVRASLGSELAG